MWKEFDTVPIAERLLKVVSSHEFNRCYARSAVRMLSEELRDALRNVECPEPETTTCKTCEKVILDEQ